MGASKTHNEVTLRPPPGTRFTIWGSDVRLEFERGRETEIVHWLHWWIDTYIAPEAIKVEQAKAATTKVKIFTKEEIAAAKASQIGVVDNPAKHAINSDTIKKLMDDILNTSTNNETENQNGADHGRTEE